jgi:hypothetical protein
MPTLSGSSNTVPAILNSAPPTRSASPTFSFIRASSSGRDDDRVGASSSPSGRGGSSRSVP